jgi:hypothetical protein
VQFTIIAARTGLTEDSALIKYFIDGLHLKLMEHVYTMEKPPSMLEGWMRAALLFDGNWRRAHAIVNQNKSGSLKLTPVPDYIPSAPARDLNAMEINTIKHLSPEERLDHISGSLKLTPVPDYVPSAPTIDPNAMDVNTIKRLSPEERLDHIKKGLCFICHKPGHLSSTHKKGGSLTTPRNFQRRTAYQKIRAITDKLDKEEKDEIAAQMEKEGF